MNIYRFEKKTGLILKLLVGISIIFCIIIIFLQSSCVTVISEGSVYVYDETENYLPITFKMNGKEYTILGADDWDFEWEGNVSYPIEIKYNGMKKTFDLYPYEVLDIYLYEDDII